MGNTKNQQLAYDKLAKLKVGALFMEMGEGKTKVALDLINSRLHKVDYVLWICPCSLKIEIKAEKEKWYPNMEMDIVGCESIGSSDRIYIETLNKVKNADCAFIVVDESLKIKNRHAKRTQRILRMGNEATYKLILNGTPVSKNILDLWTQMEFLSPKILDMWYTQFKNTYCEFYKRGKFKGKISGHHNIPHLISKIEPYIFDSELEINTSKTYYTKLYYMNDVGEYENFKGEIFNEYYDNINDDLNFNAFAIALQKWYCDYANTNKKEVIDDLLEEINDKTVVFVRFLSSIPEGAESITGADKENERKDKLSRFKNGEFNTLYITYGCGAYGLNLQFCKNIIFAEHTWDYAQRVQAEARIYRIGQGAEVFYYDLINYEAGLEDLIMRCIRKKSSLLDTVKKEIEKTKGGVQEWVKSL